MKEIITSKFMSLNVRDWLKAFLLAVIAPVLVELQKWIDALANGQPYQLEWKHVLMIAAGAGLAYILKQLFTSSKITVPNDGTFEVKKINGN